MGKNAFYSTQAWRRVRRAVLVRDGYVCRVQLPGCTHVATQAHHVLGREISPLDMDHIVSSCRHCNRQLGKPSADPQPRPMI